MITFTHRMKQPRLSCKYWSMVFIDQIIMKYKKLPASFLYFISFFLSCFSQSVFASQYFTDESDCDGYKRVLVGTMKGSCLGLVAQASEGYAFIKPRKIIQIPHKKQFLITDMGEWKVDNGTLWLLDTEVSPPKLTSLLNNLSQPHGLAMDNQGRFYVGERHQIIRFSITDNLHVEDMKTVIKDLPAWRSHRHPLSEFIFDNENNLIVNTAAPSDQCKKHDNALKACDEFKWKDTDNAALRLYHYNKKEDSWNPQYDVLASGLRNSMALAVHKTGTTLQAENNMDFSGIHTPFEEINVIEKGKFYGWPYCFNKNDINRFWTTSAKKYCLESDKYQEPWVVIAPHAAPLDMMYYNGKMFPELEGKLLLSWHGYRDSGHRIVFYDVDKLGRPLRVSGASYNINQDNGALPQKHPFPRAQKAAQAHEIIYAWNPIQGYRPKGRPVGMTVADDGAIWVLDDYNKAVLRLAKGDSYPNPFRKILNNVAVDITEEKVASLFKQHCVSCHSEIIKANENKISLPPTWLELTGDGKYRIETRLFDSSLPKMPPGTVLSNNDLTLFKTWITKYKNNKSLVVKRKAYLHKMPNSKTRMYLIKGDKVTLLDEKTDDSGQEWYFIYYKGKKKLNMWIKAEAVGTDISRNKE